MPKNMATINERELLFAEKTRPLIAKGVVKDFLGKKEDFGGWLNMARAVRYDASTRDPQEVFDTHTRLLGTAELVLRHPELKERASGDALTLRLIAQVFEQSRAYFRQHPESESGKGPFAEHQNFWTDMTSSEAVTRSLQRQKGYRFDMDEYAQRVDALCGQLILPKPDFARMYSTLIGAFGVTICRSYYEG